MRRREFLEVRLPLDAPRVAEDDRARVSDGSDVQLVVLVDDDRARAAAQQRVVLLVLRSEGRIRATPSNKFP